MTNQRVEPAPNTYWALTPDNLTMAQKDRRDNNEGAQRSEHCQLGKGAEGEVKKVLLKSPAKKVQRAAFKPVL